jgi:hypothetical protein
MEVVQIFVDAFLPTVLEIIASPKPKRTATAPRIGTHPW